MNVFEVVQLTNDRLNGGNDSKFPVTLAIVGEIILSAGRTKECIANIFSGDCDELIIYLINKLDDKNEFKMMQS